MSSFPELVNKIAADKEQAARLSGLITKSQTETEQIASSLGGVGFEERSKLFKGAGERLEQAESLRQTFEGTLAKAHWQLMSAIHGKMGPGSREHASFTQQNPDGSTVWRGWRDGSKVEITTLPPGREHEPTGMELLSEAEEEPSSRGRFRQATARLTRKADDLQSTGKNIAKTHTEAIQAIKPKPPNELTTTVEHPSSVPQLRNPVGENPVNAGDATGHGLEIALIIAGVTTKIKDARERRNASKEHPS